MRRIIQLSAACLAVSALSACSGRDTVTDTGVEPSGGVRFINAVPDTGAANGLDFRYVDFIENNAQFNIPYRNSVVTSNGTPASTQIEYKNTVAGDARHFRIFLSDTLAAVSSTRLGCAAATTTPCIGDSTMKVESGHRYTALLWGNSRTGSTPALKLTILDENAVGCADPAALVAYRAINTTASDVDVRVYTNTAVASAVAVTLKSKDATKAAATTTTTTTTNTALPAAATYTVPAMAVSATCVNLPTTPAVPSVVVGSTVTLTDTTTSVTTTTTTVTVKYNVQPAGGGTALFTDASALVGTTIGQVTNGCTVGTDCDASPGSSAAGSVLTGIIFPRSVAGSKAANVTTPSISFMWDKRPPRNAGS